MSYPLHTRFVVGDMVEPTSNEVQQMAKYGPIELGHHLVINVVRDDLLLLLNPRGGVEFGHVDDNIKSFDEWTEVFLEG